MSRRLGSPRSIGLTRSGAPMWPALIGQSRVTWRTSSFLRVWGQPHLRGPGAQTGNRHQRSDRSPDWGQGGGRPGVHPGHRGEGKM